MEAARALHFLKHLIKNGNVGNVGNFQAFYDFGQRQGGASDDQCTVKVAGLVNMTALMG